MVSIVFRRERKFLLPTIAKRDFILELPQKERGRKIIVRRESYAERQNHIQRQLRGV